jgi:Mn2+/Fe2+ NRAMP family transporter
VPLRATCSDPQPSGPPAASASIVSLPTDRPGTSTYVGVGNLTAEDLVRSRDRWRVAEARRGRRRIQLVWLLLGPGVLVMLAENDGPSMLSYTATGATYGIGIFLPLIVVTFGMATVVQEMAMRVGAVTHRGFGELVLQRFGTAWGWVAAADLVVTNLVTLVVELIAIEVGMSFFDIPGPVAVGLGLLLLAVSVMGGRYWRWERIALSLSLFNLVFVASALISHPSASSIVRSLITGTPLPHGPVQLTLLLVASTVGATITPWMLFFQQSSVADKGLTPKDIGHGRLDTVVGAALACVAGCAALVTGAALFQGHVAVGSGGAGFGTALKGVIGYPGAAVFSLGLVEAGALATMTISASTAYAFGEVTSRGHSFNRGVRDAPLFYAVIFGVALVAAAIVLIPGAPLLAITLNANLLATVLAPAALLFLLILANDRDLMGTQANSMRMNVLVVAIVAAIALVSIAYVAVSLLGAVRGIGL